MVVLWPFLPPWWLSCIILFLVRKGSRWFMMYSSMIFSIVQRLFSGLYDAMSYMGLPFFSFGVILSVLNMLGNFLSIMICLMRWVISGAIIVVVFLIIFIDMLSWPTELVLFAFFIIWAICGIVGMGISKVV